MSGRLVGQCFRLVERGVAVSPSALLVLVCMAEDAPDREPVSWLSVRRIAARTGLSKSRAHRALAELRSRGLAVPEDARRPGRRVRWRLHVHDVVPPGQDRQDAKLSHPDGTVVEIWKNGAGNVGNRETRETVPLRRDTVSHSGGTVVSHSGGTLCPTQAGHIPGAPRKSPVYSPRTDASGTARKTGPGRPDAMPERVTEILGRIMQ